MFQLTEKQKEIVNNNARVKLIMGGMRSGKTVTTIKCIEREMRMLNSKKTKVAIIAVHNRFAKMMMHDLKAYLPRDIIWNICNNELTIETVYGTIEITILDDIQDLLDAKPDVVGIDTATRNKYFAEIICKSSSKIVASGHLSDDKDNQFCNLFERAFFDQNLSIDIKAFKLKTWDNPAMIDKKEEWEKDFLKRMTLERYIRDYYATWI